jgi:hypothetical protein
MAVPSRTLGFDSYSFIAAILGTPDAVKILLPDTATMAAETSHLCCGFQNTADLVPFSLTGDTDCLGLWKKIVEASDAVEA